MPHAALAALREWTSVAREAAAARLLAQRPRDVLPGERAVANSSTAEAPQKRAVVALRSAHGTYLSAAMDGRRTEGLRKDGLSLRILRGVLREMGFAPKRVVSFHAACGPG